MSRFISETVWPILGSCLVMMSVLFMHHGDDKKAIYTLLAGSLFILMYRMEALADKVSSKTDSAKEYR